MIKKYHNTFSSLKRKLKAPAPPSNSSLIRAASINDKEITDALATLDATLKCLPTQRRPIWNVQVSLGGTEPAVLLKETERCPTNSVPLPLHSEPAFQPEITIQRTSITPPTSESDNFSSDGVGRWISVCNYMKPFRLVIGLQEKMRVDCVLFVEVSKRLKIE